MAILYVANTTLQDHDFLYRVPAEDSANSRVRMQKIRSGAQIRVHKDSPNSVLDAIIQQHAPYGLVPYDEIPKTKRYIGLCYRMDKEIDIDRLLHATDHNLGVKEEQSDQIRREGAIAVGHAIEEHSGEHVEALEVETVEITKPNADTGYAHGVEVVREGVDPSKNARAGRRDRSLRSR